ncbi:hypothetical protein AMAG_05659 [Allomyces macrogynus ATCC 38327]|uniref:Uncharacterized protein n=1 Tax=Allomyces macrogynus (strain ATCC 38327) TaxID=578462 RepID=A0A0L0SCX4_ALLM3|nr:hypothetical protein AMAG_05659 [Allomyces macrogynus ATCC 38327]|eukprot:KNE60245.1 hypothetical protein AMAG_05659 [Allomyces macrogynus ATCC 38327]
MAFDWLSNSMSVVAPSVDGATAFLALVTLVLSVYAVVVDYVVPLLRGKRTLDSLWPGHHQRKRAMPEPWSAGVLASQEAAATKSAVPAASIESTPPAMTAIQDDSIIHTRTRARRPHLASTTAPVAGYPAPAVAAAGEALAILEADAPDRATARRMLREWFMTKSPLDRIDRDAVDATWRAEVGSSLVRAFMDGVKARVDSADQSMTVVVQAVEKATDRLLGLDSDLSGSISAYLDAVLAPLCAHEAWEWIGHLQCIATHPLQLTWLHRTFELWRQSDTVLLTTTMPPLFPNPDALVHVLSCPRHAADVKLPALYELAMLDAEDWLRVVALDAIAQVLVPLAVADPALATAVHAVLARVEGRADANQTEEQGRVGADRPTEATASAGE